jgi:hypothetical protein
MDVVSPNSSLSSAHAARADKAALDKRSQRLLACLSPRGLKPKVESKKAQAQWKSRLLLGPLLLGQPAPIIFDKCQRSRAVGRS